MVALAMPTSLCAWDDQTPNVAAAAAAGITAKVDVIPDTVEHDDRVEVGGRRAGRRDVPGLRDTERRHRGVLGLHAADIDRLSVAADLDRYAGATGRARVRDVEAVDRRDDPGTLGAVCLRGNRDGTRSSVAFQSLQTAQPSQASWPDLVPDKLRLALRAALAGLDHRQRCVLADAAVNLPVGAREAASCRNGTAAKRNEQRDVADELPSYVVAKRDEHCESSQWAYPTLHPLGAVAQASRSLPSTSPPWLKSC